MASRLGTNKGRVDKGRGGASAATPVVHDIIPGKFNDLDWQQALYVEETDSFIEGLVQGVADTCLDTIYKNYLEKQLIPFTVSMAKDAIVQLVEWTFINPDEGEPDILLDSTWTEDCEPDSCAVDSWAQGALPKRPCDYTSSHPATARSSITSTRLADIHEEPLLHNETRELEVPEISVDSHATMDNKHLEGDQESNEKYDLLDSRVKGEEGVESETETQVPKPPLTKKDPFIPGWSQRPRPVRFKPYTGRITSAGLKGLVETLDQTEQRFQEEDRQREKEHLMLLKREKEAAKAAKAALKESFMFNVHVNDGSAGAYEDSHASIIDEESSVSLENKQLKLSLVPKIGEQMNAFGKRSQILLSRLNPEQLPQHKVKIHYRLVDADVDAFNARLEAIKKGRPFLEPTSGTPSNVIALSRRTAGMPTASFPSGGGTFQSKGMAAARIGEKLPPLNPQLSLKREDALIDPLPNSMIDTINLASGVVAKQGGRVRRGPKQNDANNLLPDPNSDTLKIVRPLKHDSTAQVKSVIDEGNITLRTSLEPHATIA